MKVTYDDKVFVQKKDLVFLLRCYIDNKLILPDSIFKEIYSRMLLEVDFDGKDFAMFNKKEELAFFDKIDFIMDYNEFKNKCSYCLMELEEKIIEERKFLVDSLKSHKLRSTWNCNMIGLRCEFLDYKLSSLNDILNYKRGKESYFIPNPDEKKHNRKDKKTYIKRKK